MDPMAVKRIRGDLVVKLFNKWYEDEFSNLLPLKPVRDDEGKLNLKDTFNPVYYEGEAKEFVQAVRNVLDGNLNPSQIDYDVFRWNVKIGLEGLRDDDLISSNDVNYLIDRIAPENMDEKQKAIQDGALELLHAFVISKITIRGLEKQLAEYEK
jgi:hypothetical protein